MIKQSVGKLTRTGLLGLGLVSLTVPAFADTPVSSFGISRNAVGTTQSPNLGPANSVQCALTRVRPLTSTTLAAECNLVQVAGQWRLNATVLNAGASVHCETWCYQ